MNYWIGIIGTWVLADAVSSLWAYTDGERAKTQTWKHDHSLRIVRALCGLVLIIIGAIC
jgi:hypothetical protein